MQCKIEIRHLALTLDTVLFQ